jgi:pimeloyl-ACP methyl ester carboxylesterase
VFSFDYTGHGRTPSYLTSPGDVGSAGWRGLVAAAVALVEREVAAFGLVDAHNPLAGGGGGGGGGTVSPPVCPPVLVFGHSLGSVVAFLAVDELCQRATAAAAALAYAPSGTSSPNAAADAATRRAAMARACVPGRVVLSGLPLRPGPAVAAPFRLECLNCVPLHCGTVARGVGACMEAVAPRAPNSPVKVNCLTHDAARLALVAGDFYHFKVWFGLSR